jgi:periplasmic protein TonB
MKFTSPYFAAGATFLLHVALVATVMAGLSVSKPQVTSPEPLKVQLVSLAPPAAMPVANEAPPQPPKTKQPAPKPRPQRESAAKALEAAAPQLPTPAASIESKPQPAPASVAPVISAAPAAAAPAMPASPPKTSASDAAYASSNRKPPYPRLSRINDEQGTVVLRVLVRADGTAGTVEIKISSSYPLLDESARNTVQTWRFKSATVDGKPVAEWYQLAIPFTLHEN